MSRTKASHFYVQSFFFAIVLPFLCFCQDSSSITSTISLRDSDTIESSSRAFQLGFFSPPDSTNRYLGVSYVFSRENVVWVANRDRPLNGSSGHVTIGRDGNLVLRNGQNETIWSTNVTGSIRNTSAHIEDTGNLLLRDISTGNTIWESFSHPSNVFLPTMRLTHDTNTNERVYISSWRNRSDANVGNFTGGLEVVDFIPQIYTRNNGRKFWRSGPWYSRVPMGYPDIYSSTFDVSSSVVNDGPGRFAFVAAHGNLFVKVVLNSTGHLVQTMWNDQQRTWDVTWVAPETECDMYGKCGAFGICNVLNSPICSCLTGFEPVNLDEWNMGNWTSGCLRRRPLQCSRNNNTSGNGDGFLRMPNTQVPDFPEHVESGGVDDCRSRCFENCSCIAYAYDPIMGCMVWSAALIDAQRFSRIGVDLNIRLEASELENNQQKRRLVVIIIPVVSIFVAICIIVFSICYWMVKKKGKKGNDKTISEVEDEFPTELTVTVLKDATESVHIEEVPLYTFETLANATKHFDESNLLGKGGFGSVYKGMLATGEEFAVKRLSAASGQGDKEFMNEVVVISKLQHRNLVSLQGYCAERGEKMLIFEYMQNKSLDFYLFDDTHLSRRILDWKKSFDIIKGIGRGLLYLHMDSRLKIIHRDLKPSNVLLDENWNPKISDFGTARIFGGKKEHENTTRVVGTYGYMSPEYAMEGQFSEKSDVYSFGILMLEILSGKRNTDYYNQEWSLSLLGCAWKLWNEGNELAFVDQRIASLVVRDDLGRCIHAALLCVQEHPNDRPCIQSVLGMLAHEIVNLPVPEEPLFAEKWYRSHVETVTESTRMIFHLGHSLCEKKSPESHFKQKIKDIGLGIDP